MAETKRTNHRGDALFYVGIDTHTDTHTIAVINAAQHTELTGAYPTTPKGLSAIVKELGQFGDPEGLVIGIEGTNSYGAGLNRRLQADGYTTFEVLRPPRQVRRMDGKSDPIDALEAARTVMSGKGVSIPKLGQGPAEALRYLHIVRGKYVSTMTGLLNMIISLLITAPTPLRQKYTKTSTSKTLKTLLASRPGSAGPSSVDFHVMTALKSMAQTHATIKESADRLEKQMQVILQEHYPALLRVFGVGTITAASLAITAGDNPRRIRNEAAFAKLCGACPIPASSGKTNRHRVNHGGDRQGDQALHQIALVRMSCHQPTRDYVEKQMKRGRTKKEILRQLKRALCREIYRVLTRPQIIEDEINLRELRVSKGISQTQTAQALDTYPARISEIETGRRPQPALKDRYKRWLQTIDTP